MKHRTALDAIRAKLPAPNTELVVCWHRYDDGTVQVRGERWPIERWEAYRDELSAAGADILEVRFVEPGD